MLWSPRSAPPVAHTTRCAARVPHYVTRQCRGRDAFQWVVSAGALVLGGCHGPQSALDPAGRGAERIAELFWWMATGAGIIWLAVVGLAIYAMRVRPGTHSHHTALLIIGGGAVLPTVVLAGLLAYGLALIPELLLPPAASELQIAVSAEQWWWRVRYLTSGGNGGAVDLANEIRLPVGMRVAFHLESPDVIHSFWIPALGGALHKKSFLGDFLWSKMGLYGLEKPSK